MKNLFLSLFAVFSLLFSFGLTEVSAQKKPTAKKPVLKKPAPKKPTVATKPTVKLYTVEQGQKIRVRMNDTISSKSAKVGDTFSTTVTETVYSNTGVLVIPNGTSVIGKVTAVTPAKKGGKPGTIDVNFYEIKLPNGDRFGISGDLTELDSKTAKSDNEGTASGDKMKHRKVIFIGGGGTAGAILGGVIGGGLGAAIGAGAGALGGLITESQTKGEEATVKTGTEFGVFLNTNVKLPKFVEKEEPEVPNNQ